MIVKAMAYARSTWTTSWPAQMRQGAMGMTTALIYPPSSFASTDELVEVGRAAAEYGGIYASHIRDEGAGLVGAVREAIEVGERAGMPVEIFHYKGAYKPGWGRIIREAAEEIEAEQRTLEKMKVGLQGLLRSFSFSQVEAKTTMVKAATELQIEAEKAGVEPPPMEGFMRSIFGKRAASAAVDAADSVLDSILDVLKPDRGAAAEPGNAAGEALTESSLAALTDEVEETTLDASEEEEMEAEAEVEIDPRRDPDELRRRMDDIKSEMVAVAEQMAEMERRLLLQQADLEARQAQLESDAGRAVEEDFISEEADGKGRVLTNAAGEMIGSKDVANIADIEETKREIEEALSRIDRMQQTQKDLTEEGPR